MTRCPTCLQPIPTKAQKDRKKARQDRYREKMKGLIGLARSAASRENGKKGGRPKINEPRKIK